MKLRTFNAADVSGTRQGSATIRIARQGQITLSKKVVEITGYEEGDEIGLSQDEDQPEDWYLNLAEDGFKLRAGKDGGGLCANSAGMTNTILDALEITEGSAGFLVAQEPVILDEVTYWPILTAKPFISKRSKK